MYLCYYYCDECLEKVNSPALCCNAHFCSRKVMLVNPLALTMYFWWHSSCSLLPIMHVSGSISMQCILHLLYQPHLTKWRYTPLYVIARSYTEWEWYCCNSLPVITLMLFLYTCFLSKEEAVVLLQLFMWKQELTVHQLTLYHLCLSVMLNRKVSAEMLQFSHFHMCGTWIMR